MRLRFHFSTSRADETPVRKGGLNVVNQEAPQRSRRDLTGGLNYSACFGEMLEQAAGIFNEIQNKTWLETGWTARSNKKVSPRSRVISEDSPSQFTVPFAKLDKRVPPPPESLPIIVLKCLQLWRICKRKQKS